MSELVFSSFGDPVRLQFKNMAANSDKLFTVQSDRDKIWETYLGAFPEGSDPIFRKRSEHDCSCCKHFIRGVGNVVAIRDGLIETAWDVTGLPAVYQAVADAMAAYVRSCPIEGLYITKFPTAGQATSKEAPKPGTDGPVRIWTHFSAEVPIKFVSSDPGKKIGEALAAHDVLKRGVQELSQAAVATVLDLIDSKAIYRGDEFRKAVAAFQELQNKAKTADAATQELLFWELHDAPAARMKNTAIGTLVEELSKGEDLEKAVKAFEAMVAPANYKRPTALITKGMVEAAMKTITELDLEPALDRRHAKLSDVSINSVLWADNTTKGKLKGGIAGKLMEAMKPAKFDPKGAKEISIADFLAMKHKDGIRLYLGNDLLKHFVSLTAPVHPEVKSLFKWKNDFAWSYSGNVADSMREKVVAAGGRVDGVFRFTHMWNYDPDRPNQSLMDLHVFMPGSNHTAKTGDHYTEGRRVGWNHRKDVHSGGVQDVDYTAAAPAGYVPIENITFPDLKRMPEGKYVMKVHNWAFRHVTKSGFKAEIEFEGQIFQYEHREAMANKEWVTVAEATLKNGRFSIEHVLPSTSTSQDVWGLKTLDLVRVNAIVLSPNYWDDNAVGNKHWIFVLEGCKNPEPCRGIYNEFLHPRLEAHRRVFEIIGNKTKCPVADEQVSGIGVSSTLSTKVVAVSGGTAYAIKFQ